MQSLPFSHAFFLKKPHDFSGLVDTVSAGGDTDSNGALVGGLLGALGAQGVFPPDLLGALCFYPNISAVTQRFSAVFGV